MKKEFLIFFSFSYKMGGHAGLTFFSVFLILHYLTLILAFTIFCSWQIQQFDDTCALYV